MMDAGLVETPIAQSRQSKVSSKPSAELLGSDKGGLSSSVLPTSMSRGLRLVFAG